MDVLHTALGILFCSAECAYEREPNTDDQHLIGVPVEKYDRPLYGVYCPTCLQHYEGFVLNPEGGVSDGTPDLEFCGGLPPKE